MVLFQNGVKTILDLVVPTFIYLERDETAGKNVAITITCNCLWDIDFAIQLVIKHNHIFTEISSLYDDITFRYTKKALQFL